MEWVFQTKCLHPLFAVNQCGDLERCSLRPGNAQSALGRDDAIRIKGNPEPHEPTDWLTRRRPGRPPNHVVRR